LGKEYTDYDKKLNDFNVYSAVKYYFLEKEGGEIKLYTNTYKPLKIAEKNYNSVVNYYRSNS